MSRNTIERTEGCHVVSMLADPTVAIAKGEAVVMEGTTDYMVTTLPDQSTFCQGVALEAHASGAYDCVPVLLAGPVIRVIAGSGIVPGDLVAGDAATPGEWIPDTDDPAGFALQTAADGEEVDICFVGELY